MTANKLFGFAALCLVALVGLASPVLGEAKVTTINEPAPLGNEERTKLMADWPKYAWDTLLQEDRAGKSVLVVTSANFSRDVVAISRENRGGKVGWVIVETLLTEKLTRSPPTKKKRASEKCDSCHPRGGGGRPGLQPKSPPGSGGNPQPGAPPDSSSGPPGETPPPDSKGPAGEVPPDEPSAPTTPPSSQPPEPESGTEEAPDDNKSLGLSNGTNPFKVEELSPEEFRDQYLRNDKYRDGKRSVVHQIDSLVGTGLLGDSVKPGWIYWRVKQIERSSDKASTPFAGDMTLEVSLRRGKASK